MYQRHKDNSVSISITPPSKTSPPSSNSSSPTTTNTLPTQNGFNPTNNQNKMATTRWKQFQREFYSFIFSTLGKSIVLVGSIFPPQRILSSIFSMCRHSDTRRIQFLFIQKTTLIFVLVFPNFKKKIGSEAFQTRFHRGR